MSDTAVLDTPAPTANGKPTATKPKGKPGKGKPADKPTKAESVMAKAAKMKGLEEKVDPKSVILSRAVQARTDVDSGEPIDKSRVAIFKAAMEEMKKPGKGYKFPPIEVFRVSDAPSHKDEEVDICVDGMHTCSAAVEAGYKEIPARVYVANYASALFYAATISNRQHEKNGKPLSGRDKVHAVKLYAESWKRSGVPQKDWPSNRDAADACGCSRNLVNEMDPFERGKGDVRDSSARQKKAARGPAILSDAAPSLASGKPMPAGFKAFQVNGATTGQQLLIVEAKDEKEAHEKVKRAKPTLEVGDYKLKVMADTSAVGAASATGGKSGFDWGGMEAHLAYLSRGLDGMGDIYGLKKGDEEYKSVLAGLEMVAKGFKSLRTKHGTKSK